MLREAIEELLLLPDLLAALPLTEILSQREKLLHRIMNEGGDIYQLGKTLEAVNIRFSDPLGIETYEHIVCAAQAHQVHKQFLQH